MSYLNDSEKMSSEGNSPYTVMISRGGVSSQMATPADTPSQDWDLISFLGISQQLRIEILPITWQPALDTVGFGGTAEIRQSLVRLQTSFVFKLIKQAERARWGEAQIFKMLISEISVLGHPSIRMHPNVVALQGICWEVIPGGKAWPVLVFEKAQFGNLKEFASSEAGLDMPFNARCNICAEIAVAIRDMHAGKIIHGDIKPENILIFKSPSGEYTAQVTDFGYSTLDAGNGLIQMPYSKDWTAPEWGQRGGCKFADAQKMDAYSFGLLCLWFLLCSNQMDLDSRFFDDIRSGNPPSVLANKSISAMMDLDVQERNHLHRLFELTLTEDPAERVSDFEQFLESLTSYSAQVYHPPPIVRDTSFNFHQDFQIVPSIFQLGSVHYNVRAYVAACLEHRYSVSALLPSKHAAFELALCYKFGFGVARDEGRSRSLLKKAERSEEEFEVEIGKAKYTRRSQPPRGPIYHQLAYQGIFADRDIYRVVDPLSSTVQNLSEQGLMHEIVPQLAREITDMEATLGAEHEVLTFLKNDLSIILERQGEWMRAEGLVIQVMNMNLKKKGQKHVDTLRSMDHLASIYHAQKRYEDAEKLQTQVVKINSSALNPTHPDLLRNRQRLALILASRGRWKEAEEMQLRVTREITSALGPEHHSTLAATGNLATIYGYQKKWRDAEELQMPVTKKMKTAIGSGHSDSLTSMSYMALYLMKQKRWKEAEELQMQVMQMTSTLFGAEHPDTLGSMIVLGNFYREQGRFQEAEELHTQVTETRKRMLGPEDSRTLSSLTNLAIDYEAQNRWREAEDLHLQVFTKMETVSGSKNPDILKNTSHLAGNYQGQKKWGKAEELQRQVVQMSTAAMGPKHPETLIHMHNLAFILWSQKQWTEAEALQEQVMDLNLEVLGSDHPETLSSMILLAQTYQCQGQLKRAENLQIKAIKTGERDPEIPHTLRGMVHLASNYIRQKRWDEAERLLIQAMSKHSMISGQEDPCTLHSMNQLVLIYRKQERWQEAEQLAMHLMTIRKKVLGLEHPDTLRSMAQLASAYNGQGNSKDKEDLEVKIPESGEAGIGQENPAALLGLVSAKSSWTAQKYREEALHLLSETIKLSNKALGSGHPSTVSRMQALERWTNESQTATPGQHTTIPTLPPGNGST